MKNMVIIFMALFILQLFSCQKNEAGGTTTGNPLVSFTMTGSAAAPTVAFLKPGKKFPFITMLQNFALALPPPVLVDSTSSPVSLAEAWIVVKEVEFKPSTAGVIGEVDGDSITFVGPKVVNLIASNIESFGQARVSTSTLRRIKMQLHNADVLPSGAPLELQNKSVYWKGSVGGRQFTFVTTEGFEFELGGPNGVVLSENSSVLLSIQIANLFKKMNLSTVPNGAAISQSNRVPAIDPCPLIKPSAADIYTCFTEGLKSEANLGRDDGNDGELSGDATVM